MIKRRILVIEDDLSICHSIRERMEDGNIDVYCTSFSIETLSNYAKQEFCLIIMDIQLSGIDGLEMIRMMRKGTTAPILLITPRLKPNEKVALFQAGANAYIEKPVDITVCTAQAATLIQLYLDSDYSAKTHCLLTFGTERMITPVYRQVIIDGIVIDLTRTEFDLLFCLTQHPEQVWSRTQLYHHVWKDSLGVDGENTVRTHIGNLRKKLADAGKEYVQTSRGIGYKFVPPNLK